MNRHMGAESLDYGKIDKKFDELMKLDPKTEKEAKKKVNELDRVVDDTALIAEAEKETKKLHQKKKS